MHDELLLTSWLSPCMVDSALDKASAKCPKCKCKCNNELIVSAIRKASKRKYLIDMVTIWLTNTELALPVFE